MRQIKCSALFLALLAGVGGLAPAPAEAAPILYAATFGNAGTNGGTSPSGARTVASNGTVGTPTGTRKRVRFTYGRFPDK